MIKLNLSECACIHYCEKRTESPRCAGLRTNPPTTLPRVRDMYSKATVSRRLPWDDPQRCFRLCNVFSAYLLGQE